VALFLLALASGRAEAQTTDSSAFDTAAKEFANGKRLAKEGKYLRAIAAFEKAYTAHPHYYVHCSIARCYEQMKQMVKAADYYRSCLKLGADKASIAPEVVGALKKAEAQISWVEVKSPGAGGTIEIDGRARGKTPKQIPLDPGSHVVVVRRERAAPASATLLLYSGETRSVTLVPEGPSPAPSRTLPATAAEPAVRATSGPRPRRRLSQIWLWSAAGVTASLAVAGIVLGAQTLSLQSDFEEQPSHEALDRFKSRRLATNIVWGLAAAAAGAGTVIYFYTDFKGATARPEGRRSLVMGIGARGTF
jgi:tetratricopeptide (TPR) repeat protein